MAWLSRMRNRFFSIPLLSLGLLSALLVPKAQVWERWAKFGAGQQIDHTSWDQFLQNYRVMGTDGIARVRYGAVRTQDAQALRAYLTILQKIEPTRLSKPQALAYWVNLYNATTVNLILRNYPLASIRDIKPGFFSFGPWNEKILTVAGVAMSLNDIEHRVLRPLWANDPRIHYVVNCASYGCPDLPERALTEQNQEPILQNAAIAFINHPRAMRVKEGKLILSSIYDWYAKDFDVEGGVVMHLQRYANAKNRPMLKDADISIEYQYGWSLNDAR
jgi:hypothetical protein